MDIYAHTDAAVLREIRRHRRRRRLDRNWTQAALAERAGLDRMTVGALERGTSGGALSLLQVLRALGLLEELAPLVEEPGPSPLEVMRSRGRERRRASPRTDPSATDGA